MAAIYEEIPNDGPVLDKKIYFELQKHAG